MPDLNRSGVVVGYVVEIIGSALMIISVVSFLIKLWLRSSSQPGCCSKRGTRRHTVR